MGGSLKLQEIKAAAAKHSAYSNIRFFVETGTYKADTTIMVADHYSKVWTTEIVPELHYTSKARAEKEGKFNIEFMLGDSVKLLAGISPALNEGAVFFIDAHQSGPDTSNNGKQVPLMEELAVLLTRNLGPSIFIFDDTRFWPNHSQAAWDWTDVSTAGILKMFEQGGYHVDCSYEEDDRFFVLARYGSFDDDVNIIYT
jgi:hypothetical protein